MWFHYNTIKHNQITIEIYSITTLIAIVISCSSTPTLGLLACSMLVHLTWDLSGAHILAEGFLQMLCFAYTVALHGLSAATMPNQATFVTIAYQFWRFLRTFDWFFNLNRFDSIKCDFITIQSNIIKLP